MSQSDRYLSICQGQHKSALSVRFMVHTLHRRRAQPHPPSQCQCLQCIEHINFVTHFHLHASSSQHQHIAIIFATHSTCIAHGMALKNTLLHTSLKFSFSLRPPSSGHIHHSVFNTYSSSSIQLYCNTFAMRSNAMRVSYNVKKKNTYNSFLLTCTR